VPSNPGPPRRKKKKTVADDDVYRRLTCCETLLKAHGIDINEDEIRTGKEGGSIQLHMDTLRTESAGSLIAESEKSRFIDK
jgi:hypothetical protein